MTFRSKFRGYGIVVQNLPETCAWFRVPRFLNVFGIFSCNSRWAHDTPTKRPENKMTTCSGVLKQEGVGRLLFSWYVVTGVTGKASAVVASAVA